MKVQKDSFFRIFQAEVRGPLQRFFENRHSTITPEIANDFADVSALERLIALELIEYDVDAEEYRLDDRVERFLDEMLGAVEVAQSDWLMGLLEEIRRSIEGYHKLSDAGKGEALLRRICRILRTSKSRIHRHLEEVKSAVDYDYRAGSDYEVKLMKLGWHLDRAKNYGTAIVELDSLLRNDTFFQVHQEIELLSLRRQVIYMCSRVGDALIDVYQRIEDYLNRVQRDYVRARKLLRLCGLLDRHEHLTATNLLDVANTGKGPWFYEFNFRTLLDPAIIDSRSDLLQRALDRAGIGETSGKKRQVEISEEPFEEIPPVIDWQNVYEAFTKQGEDLFVFLGKVRVEGRLLTEEERIDGYCSILTNDDWAEAWDGRPFDLATDGQWEYALVRPPALLTL